MCRRIHISRRRRILWIGTVLFCLLFQQLAMAGYVCTMPMGSVGASLTNDCAAMGMGSSAPAVSKHMHSTPDPRCIEHCSGHTTSAPDARVPMVPPLLLPPAAPMLVGTIAHAPEQAPLPDPTLRRLGPPPTLQFCSLLI